MRKRKAVRFKKKGKYWYYNIWGTGFRSSGLTSREKCEQVAYALFMKERGNADDVEFRTYAKHFFIWGECTRLNRLIEEGWQVSFRYAQAARRSLEHYIFREPIADLKMGEIKRSDILKVRTSLVNQGLSAGSVNRIIKIVKIVFNEAEFQKDIIMNPAKGIGKIQGPSKKPDIFTADEMYQLFSNGYAIWEDILGYTCFYIAAATGMRKGEILALAWKHIDFERNIISVERSWQGPRTLSLPKWGVCRTVYMSESLRAVLLKYRESLGEIQPEDLVICKKNGNRLSDAWWQYRFKRAMQRFGIELQGRIIKPHSFRHTVCTMLLDAGEHPDKVCASLGWSTKKMRRNYTHWEFDHLKEQKTVMDAIWDDIFQ